MPRLTVTIELDTSLHGDAVLLKDIATLIEAYHGVPLEEAPRGRNIIGEMESPPAPTTEEPASPQEAKPKRGRPRKEAAAPASEEPASPKANGSGDVEDQPAVTLATADDKLRALLDKGVEPLKLQETCRTATNGKFGSPRQAANAGDPLALSAIYEALCALEEV